MKARWSATGALARRTFTWRPVSRDIEVERSETEMERETGCEAPSTKQSVEFIYRLG